MDGSSKPESYYNSPRRNQESGAAATSPKQPSNLESSVDRIMVYLERAKPPSERLRCLGLWQAWRLARYVSAHRLGARVVFEETGGTGCTARALRWQRRKNQSIGPL